MNKPQVDDINYELAGKGEFQSRCRGRKNRNYRGMTQNALAAAADINAVYLSQIETGKRTGSARTLAALAKALQVTVDDLL